MNCTHATLPLSCLEQHLDNVRSVIDQKGLEPLVENLKLMGLLVELIVFPHPTKKGVYIIADGNRRFLAMLQAAIHEAKCLVLESEPDPIDLLAMQVALGNTGEKLKTLDTADAAQKIMSARANLSRKQVAAMLGVSAPTLSNCLNLSEHLAPALRARVEGGELPPSCAFCLARLEGNHAAQIELADLYVAGRLTRDSLYERVKKLLGKEAKSEVKPINLRCGGVVVRYVGEKVEGLLADLASLADKVKRSAKPTDLIAALPVLLKRSV
jgi:ParB/RepB/Spo0J family partition protein